MKKNYLRYIAILAVATLSACAQQAWYEGIKQNQRQDCYKSPPGEREECLRRVGDKSYDDYRREKQETQKQ